LKHVPASKIALIGSFQDFLHSAMAVFIGRLFDIGYFRIPLLLSSCVVVASTILIGECTEYWQNLLMSGCGLVLCNWNDVRVYTGCCVSLVYVLSTFYRVSAEHMFYV